MSQLKIRKPKDLSSTDSRSQVKRPFRKDPKPSKTSRLPNHSANIVQLSSSLKFEELSQHKKSLESLLIEANHFNKTMLLQIQRLKEEQARTRQTSVHYQKERSRLARTIERLRQSKEDEPSFQPRRNLEQKVLHYFKELEQKDSLIKQLRNQLQEQRKMRQTGRDHFQQMEDRLHSTLYEIKQMKLKMFEMEEENGSLKEVNERLKQENSCLGLESSRLFHETQEKDQKRVMLQETIRDLKNGHNEILQDYTKKLEMIKKSLQEKNNRIIELQQKLSDNEMLARAESHKQGSLDLFVSSNDTIQRINRQLTQEIKHLTSSLSQLHTENSQLLDLLKQKGGQFKRNILVEEAVESSRDTLINCLQNSYKSDLEDLQKKDRLHASTQTSLSWEGIEQRLRLLSIRIYDMRIESRQITNDMKDWVRKCVGLQMSLWKAQSDFLQDYEACLSNSKELQKKVIQLTSGQECMTHELKQLQISVKNKQEELEKIKEQKELQQSENDQQMAEKGRNLQVALQQVHYLQLEINKLEDLLSNHKQHYQQQIIHQQSNLQLAEQNVAQLSEQLAHCKESCQQLTAQQAFLHDQSHNLAEELARAQKKRRQLQAFATQHKEALLMMMDKIEGESTEDNLQQRVRSCIARLCQLYQQQTQLNSLKQRLKQAQQYAKLLSLENQVLKEVNEAIPRRQKQLHLQLNVVGDGLSEIRENVAPRLRKDRDLNIAQCQTNSEVRGQISSYDRLPSAFSYSQELEYSEIQRYDGYQEQRKSRELSLIRNIEEQFERVAKLSHQRQQEIKQLVHELSELRIFGRSVLIEGRQYKASSKAGSLQRMLYYGLIRTLYFMSSKKVEEIKRFSELYAQILNSEQHRVFQSLLQGLQKCFSESDFEELLEDMPQIDEVLTQGLYSLRMQHSQEQFLDDIAQTIGLKIKRDGDSVKIGEVDGFRLVKQHGEWLLEDRQFQ